ncbi:GNAT family N-acetyltransferase [Pseudohongiella sp.]|uniref:N-acetyltransferase domain-containing protein n=1 Tax=marine sediment metagenome TaxID=412755 RepID=A0A0F9YID0_9ZZZZ|nr:GNAT family N-acetyltransferase [Pseudohongiella sp.]HDZ07841.1 GNAT family N-acetyltransferase [Pseudohongiella sp.]HEA62842.1 GNAT family N-acetyltransferase [Pseudohongiella sp.]
MNKRKRFRGNVLPEITLLIRPFMKADREALSRLYLESRQDTFTWQNSAAFCLSDFDRDTAEEAIWVAERQGALVGFVSVDAADNFVHNLFVATHWLGHGIGSQLLATSLANIGSPARLKCLVENTRAIVFYQTKGWQKVGDGVSDDGKYVVFEMDNS